MPFIILELITFVETNFIICPNQLSFSRGRRPKFFFVTNKAATAATVKIVVQPFLTLISWFHLCSATIQMVTKNPVRWHRKKLHGPNPTDFQVAREA